MDCVDFFGARKTTGARRSAHAQGLKTSPRETAERRSRLFKSSVIEREAFVAMDKTAPNAVEEKYAAIGSLVGGASDAEAREGGGARQRRKQSFAFEPLGVELNCTRGSCTPERCASSTDSLSGLRSGPTSGFRPVRCS